MEPTGPSDTGPLIQEGRNYDRNWGLQGLRSQAINTGRQELGPTGPSVTRQPIKVGRNRSSKGLQSQGYQYM